MSGRIVTRGACAAGLLLSAATSLAAERPVRDGTRSGNAAPVIEVFNVRSSVEGWYMFEGRVVDETPEYCLVYLGGVAGNEVVVCETDGTFSFAKQLGTYESGPVSAQAEDDFGYVSEIVRRDVSTTRPVEARLAAAEPVEAGK